MFEIELKAWVDDPIELNSTLLRIGVFLGKSEKKDGYWNFPGGCENWPNKKFRIRDEGDIHTVTYKEKTVSEGMEVNREMEFQVSPAAEFIALMEQIGCTLLYRKYKMAEKYRVGRCLVESVMVEGLGPFVEIEILVEDNNSNAISIARSELFSVLDSCGIARSSIESRFYSDLLGKTHTPGFLKAVP